MDLYKLLDNIGLEELVNLIYRLDSEGDAIQIVDENHHRFFKVKYDVLRGLELTSEGDLAVKLDSEGLEFDSEGFIKLLFDDSTIVLDSEGKLAANVDFETILFNSEGKLSARSVKEGEAIEITESEGEQVINVRYDNKTIMLNSENELFAIPEPLHDGVATHVVFGTSE